MDTAPPSRSLWQIPTFLVGIISLVAVWFARPYWQQTPAQRYEQDLAGLRQLLDKNPVDVTQVQTLLRKVHGIDPPASLEKQAAYVIGSAIVVVAEATASPEDAAEQWKAGASCWKPPRRPAFRMSTSRAFSIDWRKPGAYR